MLFKCGNTSQFLDNSGKHMEKIIGQTGDARTKTSRSPVVYCNWTRAV
jgi:hypothetical protein